jgi:hypothetical protein
MVELALPLSGFREASLAIVATESMELKSSTAKAVTTKGYCFSDPAVADAFRARFGGERVIAACRPNQRRLLPLTVTT